MGTAKVTVKPVFKDSSPLLYGLQAPIFK